MSPLSILILGQSPEENHQFMARLRGLEQNHFTLSEVRCINDGLKKVREIAFDLIFIDMSANGRFGLEHLKRLTGETPYTPVIAITDIPNEKKALEVLKHGAQDFIDRSSINGSMLNRVIHYSIERLNYKSRFQKQEEQLLTITQNNHDGMVIVDHDRYIHFSNPAAEAILYTQGSTGVGGRFPWSLEEGNTFNKNISVNNNEICLEIHISPISWNNEIMSLITLRDISASEKAKKLKHETEELKMVKEMAAGIAHEFSQPLQVLSGTLEMMEVDGPTPQRIEKCKKMNQRVVDLVGSLRDLTHIRKRDYLDYKIMNIKASGEKTFSVQ